MAKLHELLAVEADLKSTYNAILLETAKVFKHKGELFTGFVRTLKWFDDNAPEAPEERKALSTTVPRRLDYQNEHVVRYLDAVFQKELANQQAKADIIVDGKTLAENVPATYLLGLETKLKQLKSVYLEIPTLPPGISWKIDDTQGKDVFITQFPEETYKTEKKFKVQVLYEATKEHPAQVEKIPETENVGKYTRYTWSGAITAAEKSKLIGRIDKLLRAVKKARQRANNVDVKKDVIGKKLIDYING